VNGREDLTGSLAADILDEIVAEALAERAWEGRRVLALVPDLSRKAPINRLFRRVFTRIGRDVRALDVLVASGTHRPMRPAEIAERIGGPFPGVGLAAHVFDDPAELTTVGAIPGTELAALTDGLFRDDLPVTINRRVFDYDTVLILGPVSPHEAAGFSGGNKYLIPGIAGPEVISAFHWLAAVITNLRVNGVKENPVRQVIDRAASLVGVDVVCFSFVVREDGGLGCLYAGSPQAAWSCAADYSGAYHIRYLPRRYELVVGLAPPYLDDLWVGGKVMYKHEPILEDGGELIIYAPHIRELSHTHGEKIRQVGYHVRDYYLKQWDRFSGHSLLVLAHSANVRGVGEFVDGLERPRVRVTLATGIPEAVCREVGLGYRDPGHLDIDSLRHRETEGILVVDRAGQTLYRLAS
jgi:nickel-dependent lactate racemase